MKIIATTAATVELPRHAQMPIASPPGLQLHPTCPNKIKWPRLLAEHGAGPTVWRSPPVADLHDHLGLGFGAPCGADPPPHPQLPTSR